MKLEKENKMKEKIKLGKVVVGRQTYKDSSLGDLYFYVPIMELNTDNFLCLSFKSGGNVRDISIDAISYNKVTSQIINSVADLVIFGYMDLNEEFIEYIVDTAERYLETGIRDEIVRALVACGALTKSKTKVIDINITHLLLKGACSTGLKAWINKYDREDVNLEVAIKEAPQEYKEWLIDNFKTDRAKEEYSKEDVRKFLQNLIK